MGLRGSTVALALAAALAGCTESPAVSLRTDTAAVEDPRVTRADSAGVEIVTTAEATWPEGEEWRIGDPPLLAVADSVLAIRRAAGITRLSSGEIVVADAGGRIVLLDSSGAVTRTLASRVAGRPYRTLFWIAAAGDTVLAYDIADHRLVRYPPAAAPTAIELRTVARSSFTPLRPLGRFVSGGIVAASGGSSFPFPGDEYEARRDSAVLLRYSPSGRVRDTLMILPWGETFGVPTRQGRRQMLVPMPLPYGRTTSAATAGNQLYVGTGERYEIAVFDTTGALVRVVRVPVEPDSLTGAAADSYVARMRSRVPPGDSVSADRALADALEHAPFPRRLPAYERVLVDSSGVIWVLDAMPVTRESVTWRVFAADGRYLGVVPMPSRLVVHEIGTDYVLGLWSSDDGGREVRMYRIQKPVRAADTAQ